MEGKIRSWLEGKEIGIHAGIRFGRTYVEKDDFSYSTAYGKFFGGGYIENRGYEL